MGFRTGYRESYNGILLGQGWQLRSFKGRSANTTETKPMLLALVCLSGSHHGQKLF